MRLLFERLQPLAEELELSDGISAALGEGDDVVEA
jgi:hypothetical protein